MDHIKAQYPIADVLAVTFPSNSGLENKFVFELNCPKTPFTLTLAVDTEVLPPSCSPDVFSSLLLDRLISKAGSMSSTGVSLPIIALLAVRRRVLTLRTPSRRVETPLLRARSNPCFYPLAR